MLILGYFFIILGIIQFSLGVFVFARGPRRPVHISFLLLTIFIGLWIAGLTTFDYITNTLLNTIVNRAANAFAIITIFTLPLLVYTFPRNKWPKWWIALLTYIPALILLVLTANGVFESSILFNGTSVSIQMSHWFLPLITIPMGYLILALSIFLTRYCTAQLSDQVRMQYTGSGLVVFILVTEVCSLLLPWLGYTDYLIIAPIFSLMIMLFLFAIAITQRELINVRIILMEVFVFLIVSLALTSRLLAAKQNIEIMTILALFGSFVIIAISFANTIVTILRQRRQLNIANAKLQQMMDIKTEFLQIASHQLRTPLTSLRLLANMEAQGNFDNKREDFHKELVTSIDRLHELVNDLLKTLSLEGETMPLKFTDVDLVTLINSAIETLKPNFDKKGLYIAFKHPTRKIPLVQADAEYLRQVFTNLIDNAERYTTKGGITITLQQDAGVIIAEIQDTGIGITQDEMKAIFKKFARSDRAKELRSEGTGLGLFIARKIIESHYGRLILLSDGSGKGTTAEIIIPIKQCEQFHEPDAASDDLSETFN